MAQTKWKPPEITLVIPTIAALWFIQALRMLLPGLYIAAFHLVFQDSNPVLEGLKFAALLFFLVPLFIPKLFARRDSNQFEADTVLLLAAARILLSFRLSSLAETLLSAVLITVFCVYIAAYLHNLGSARKFLGISFILAVMVDIAILSLGDTMDHTWAGAAGLRIGLNAGLGLLVIGLQRVILAHKLRAQIEGTEEANEDAPKKGPPKITTLEMVLAGLASGCALFLLQNQYLYASGPRGVFTATQTTMAAIMTLIALILLGLIAVIDYTAGAEILVKKLFFYLSFTVMVGLIPGNTLALVPLTLVFPYLMLKIGDKPKRYGIFLTVTLFLALILSVLYTFTTDWAFTITALRGVGPVIEIIAYCTVFICILVGGVIKGE
jgi:hypothetical protein